MKSWSVGAAALVLFAHSGPTEAQSQNPARIRWTDSCPVTAGPTTRCGEIELPEQRGSSSSKTVIVRFAMIPAPDPASRRPDPMLFLMGGQGAGLSVVNEVASLAPLLNRDVYVVEQRGNPLSHPFFGCDSVPYTGALHMIWYSIPAFTPGSVARCKAELRERGADFNAYMTPAAADDLIDLRKALGIDKWNVYGVSYGGRVATTLLRKDPSAVRSMVLDSAQITGAHISGWDRLKTLDAFFSHCAASAVCGTSFPDLKGHFERAIQALHARPAVIAVDGQAEELRAIDFVNIVVRASYSDGKDAFSRLPAAITAAGRGDYAPALSLSGFYSDHASADSPSPSGYPVERFKHIAQQVGMLCEEDGAYQQPLRDQSEARAAGWKPATLAVITGERALEQKVCRTWSFAPVDPAQSQPPTGNAPTLILNGDHDTVAPPSHGSIAARSLAHARQIIFPWTGHAMILERPACALPNIIGFIEAPERPIDRRCVDQISEPNWLPTGKEGGLGIVQTTVRNQVANTSIPGRAAYIIAPLVNVQGLVAAGVRDRSTGQSLTGSELIRVASQTKMFTAAAILRLSETNQLKLDDVIESYIPREIADALRLGGYDSKAITIRQLLTHTSGLYDFANDAGYQAAVQASPAKRWTRIEQIRWATERGFRLGAPGARFAYSDTGYSVLGSIIEHVTEKPQAAAYRELLDFDRLGLRHTWFETLESPRAESLARAHQYIGPADATGLDPSFDLYGGGGLISTLEDQAHWAAALFGGQVFENPDTLKTMMTVPTVSRGAWSGNDYAMGLYRVTVDGVDCWGHGGFWGSSVVHCPALKLTVAASRYTVEEPAGYDGFAVIKSAIAMQRLNTSPAFAKPK